MHTMSEVEIYTDGSCLGNPGPGGWGAILKCKNIELEISGGQESTTNNQMEIRAAIEGLKRLKTPCNVTIYSDSAYLVSAFNKNWIDGWLMNGWVNSAKKPVANKELWLELIELTKKHRVTWVKVRGHSDNEYNNRCDRLAVKESSKYKMCRR